MFVCDFAYLCLDVHLFQYESVVNEKCSMVGAVTNYCTLVY